MIQTADLSIEPVKARRITVIDALRGFALLGVIIIHMMQRFINIFAFLFGLSFFIQMDSASRKGVDFRKRFLWRMAILFTIGIVGNSFFTSDILSIYAFFGVIMVFLFLGFITLYQIKAVGRYLDILTPYGRMGLTNYEMQGVLGAIMFSFWGFGSFFSTLGATELFVLGIIIYISQMLFSKYWLKYFLYGPLEWLWRSGTYLKWQPLRKK